jgi:SRSO17 transposase
MWNIIPNVIFKNVWLIWIANGDQVKVSFIFEKVDYKEKYGEIQKKKKELSEKVICYCSRIDNKEKTWSGETKVQNNRNTRNNERPQSSWVSSAHKNSPRKN